MVEPSYEEDLLRQWFPADAEEVLKPFTESDICGIADVLERSSRDVWSRIPRIYSILRKIGQLGAIDAFIDSGVTDVSFPFSKSTLPEALRDHSARLKFLELQHLVYNTEALSLERKARHGHFSDPHDVPLKKVGELGKGGFGYVDRVVSTISHKEYARKLILRGRTFRKDKQVLNAFTKELSNLKRLSHRHLVNLVGSYTDKKFVAIIMLPVADINLQTFLEKSDLDDRARSFIRPFFGCLTAALCYLHDNRIRHKDIKPSNVLIKHDQVYLTDFGTSLDWSGHDNSTTATAPPTTPRYCAPEVMSYVERNTSSDIWSLGCVFLEMWTVLRQHTLEDLRTYMSAHGTQVKEYHSNPDGFAGWIQVLERIAGPSCDQALSEWVSNMLQLQPALRWNCHILEDRIRETSTDPTAEHAFSGLCCLEPDEDTTDTGSSSVSETDKSTPAFDPGSYTHQDERMRRAWANTNPAATFAPLPLSKKVAPPPFFRWAADSGTTRKELVDSASVHTDGVPIPRVVISDYNAPMQPRVEDESESLAREIQGPSVSPPSTKEAETASIDEDEVASPPLEEDTPSSLGEESWVSGFKCMICRSGLDTVADTVELPCHHWIHTACFSRGYPHYSGYCTTCSIANQKPPKQANRGFAGPHRWGSPQQSLESRAKDAEARANVFAAWQKMKQPLDERVEDESHRSDLERRPISPNPVTKTSKSKSTSSGRTLRDLFSGSRTERPIQAKAHTKSNRTTVSDRELRPEHPVSTRNKPRSSNLDVVSESSASSAEPEARVMQKVESESSAEEEARVMRKARRRVAVMDMEDIDKPHYYDYRPSIRRSHSQRLRSERKDSANRVGTWLDHVQNAQFAPKSAASDVEVDDWELYGTMSESSFKLRSGYRTPPLNQSPSQSEHESETGHSRDQQRSASVEAQIGDNPISRPMGLRDWAFDEPLPGIPSKPRGTKERRPPTFKHVSSSPAELAIPSSTTRYYYPAPVGRVSSENSSRHTVLREPGTRTRREGRGGVRVHQESSTPITNVDKPRRRGRQPSLDPEDEQYNSRRDRSYSPVDVQYSRKYGPEDVRWAPRSGEDDRGYTSKPSLGRHATYAF